MAGGEHQLTAAGSISVHSQEPVTQEPFAVRWQRRAVTIPGMLVLTTAGLVGFPFFVLVAVVLDLLRFRVRLPTLRVYLFLLQYAINESVEILLSPFLWIAGGCGRRLGSPASIARHERLQWWSLQLLAKRADQLLGLRVALTEGSDASLTPGPAIVLCRHVSLIDASLPGLVYQQRGFHIRGVIMAEMLTDPGFDLLYGRLGSVFIPRDTGTEATAAVRHMAQGLDEQTVAVIFPEGRLYRDSVRSSSLTRLAESAPERAHRLASLSRVLPPRPGGVLALLDAAPTADVVVLNHTGLDNFARIADLAKAVPVDSPVLVHARRIPRDQVPSEPAEQTRWLDELWLSLDRQVQRGLPEAAQTQL